MEPNEDDNRQSLHFHSVEPSTAKVEASSVYSEKRERESQRKSAATLSRSVANERREIDIGMTQDISSENSSSLHQNGRDSSSSSESTDSIFKCLPTDLINQILIRLPVCSIVKCSSVCKDWYSLIKSCEFIEAHRSHRLIASPSSYLISFICWPFPKRYFTLHSDNGSSCQIHLIPDYDFYSVVGIIQGLIYCSLPGSNGFIWNPSIKRLFSIPDEPDVDFPTKLIYLEDFDFGFGFDSVKNDYNVVKIVFYVNDQGDHFPWAGVYSLKEISWKMLDATTLGSITSFSGGSYFTKGSIYWIVVNQNNFILSFNVHDECFKRMMLPQELVMADYFRLTISETKGLLSIFHFYDKQQVIGVGSDFCDIWVQQDYTLESSWCKFCRIDLEGGGLKSVLEVRDNDEILIVKKISKYRAAMAIYDPMTRETKPFGVSVPGDFFYAELYNESLVLLDRVGRSYDDHIKIKEANRNLKEGIDFGKAYLESSQRPVSDDEEEDDIVSDDEEEDDFVSDDEEVC